MKGLILKDIYNIVNAAKYPNITADAPTIEEIMVFYVMEGSK